MISWLRRRPPATLAAVTGLYALIACVVAQPTTLHLGTRLLGSGACDLYLGVWGFWWYRQCLEHLASPLHTALLGAPVGGSLFVADPLNALLSLPLQATCGLTAAYNLVVLGHLVLAGTATWSLLRYLKVTAGSALAGGLVFAFNAFVLGYIHNAVTQEISVGWFPLLLLRLLMAVRHRSHRNIAWAALSMALCIASSWYHAGSLIVLLTLTAGWLTWRKAWRSLRTVVWVTTVAAVMVAPYVHAQVQVAAAPDTLEVRGERTFKFSFIGYEASDLHSWVRRSSGPTPGSPTYVHRVFFSPLTLGLCLLGWRARGRRSLTSRGALALLVVFTTLSAGYFAWSDGSMLRLGGHLVPLPALLLHHHAPLFGWLDFPHRSIPLAYLGAAALTAQGCDLVLRTVPRGWSSVAFMILANLLLWDYLGDSAAPLPLASSDAQPAASTVALQQLPPGGVIDLPAWDMGGPHSKRYVYEQIYHQRPIPFGIDVCIPMTMPGALAASPPLHTLALMARTPSAGCQRRTPGELRSQLARLGFVAVIVHQGLLAEEARDEAEQMLKVELGEPQRCGEDRIYRLDTYPGAPP